MRRLKEGMAALALVLFVLVVTGQSWAQTPWEVTPTRVAIKSGASLDIVSGGELDFESGSSFKIGGVAVTASAAELNAFAGTGLSSTEAGYLDGVTAGTRAASKAVVLGATSSIDDWTVLDDLVVHDDATVNGDLTSTGTVTGAALVASTGNITATAGALVGLRTVTTVTTDTVLTAAQCKYGVVLLAAAQDDTTITLTVPAVAAGWDVVFVDADVTAGADLRISMGTGDTINGGTAAKDYVHGGGSTAIGLAHFVTYDTTDMGLCAPPTEAGVAETTLPKWRNDNT